MSAPAVNEALAAIEGLLSTDEQQHATNGVHWLHKVAPHALPAVARVFREAGHMLQMFTCLDFVESDGVFRLVQQFAPPDRLERHRVVADVPADQEAPTISGVFAGANWQEREIFDMFGLRFAGHPALERLLMPEDSTWHPLRRGFHDPSTMPPPDAAAGGTDGAA
jgi:NADH:ubiquinone oxidoreductase subunit C